MHTQLVEEVLDVTPLWLRLGFTNAISSRQHPYNSGMDVSVFLKALW